MNYKRYLNKSTIIYIIIILALGILFNNSNKTKRDNVNEGFNSNRVDINKLSDIENLDKYTEGFIPNANSKDLYENEKQNFISKFIYGKNIFNSIVNLSTLNDNNNKNNNNLIRPSELSDLANNIKTELDSLTDTIFNDFTNIKFNDIDNYFENEYINKTAEFYNKYDMDYPGIKEYLDKEFTHKILEKIDYTLENEGNAKNFKFNYFDEFVDTNDIMGLNAINDKLEAKNAELEADEKMLDSKKKLSYIRAKIAGDSGDSVEDLKKLMEGFYNPLTTIKSTTSTTSPSSVSTTTTNAYRPLLKTPASFDGLTNEELEIVKRNQVANTPQNIDTVLIDPLKAVENVQDDVLQLLENFNNNKKKEYLNRKFSFDNDSTNRGSYLVNSKTDELFKNSVANLSYYSNNSQNSIYPNIIPPKEKIQKVLSEKRISVENNDLYRSFSNTSPIEGFEDTSATQQSIKVAETGKQPELLNTFDNFIKYSSSTILGLINKFTSGSIDLNNMDNNKMQSYGIVIIAIAILFFFISSSD